MVKINNKEYLTSGLTRVNSMSQKVEVFTVNAVRMPDPTEHFTALLKNMRKPASLVLSISLRRVTKVLYIFHMSLNL